MDFLSLAEKPATIENLNIHFNSDGWGPVSFEKLELFSDVPYAHFDKKDKMGRPADFVQTFNPTFQQKSFQKRRDDYYQNNDFSFKHDTAEDNTFQLVDTSKTSFRAKGQSTSLFFCCLF
jgi:hypothetical protein